MRFILSILKTCRTTITLAVIVTIIYLIYFTPRDKIDSLAIIVHAMATLTKNFNNFTIRRTNTSLIAGCVMRLLVIQSLSHFNSLRSFLSSFSRCLRSSQAFPLAQTGTYERESCGYYVLQLQCFSSCCLCIHMKINKLHTTQETTHKTQYK